MAIHKVILTCSAAIFSGHGVYNIYTVILSPPSDYKNFWVASPSQRPFSKNIQGIVSGLFLEIRMSILKSVALAIFKLLAFNAPTV